MSETSRNPAKPAPTLNDVAAALGVSRTTVSNAFNRPDQLSTDLRHKVMEAAKALGYPGPNPMARMLRTGRAEAIGFVFEDSLSYAFEDPTAIAFLQGVAKVCEKAGHSILVTPASNPDSARATIRAAAVDGFIIYCLSRDHPIVDAVLERRLPVVAVDLGTIPGVPSVGIDDRAAAAIAARHLLELGHRRFGIIGLELQNDGYVGPVTEERRANVAFPICLERILGYEDSLEAAGLPAGSWAIEECCGNQEQSGVDAALKLLSAPDRPTALLAMSDRLAIGAMKAARLLGLNVPEDLSIIGFDDIPMASRIDPGLTTIRQPLVEKAAEAARMLLDTETAPESLVLPTELVVRGTTARPGIQADSR